MSVTLDLFSADDNPGWYYTGFKINVGLAIASTSVSVFFIVRKTPKSIGAYKYFLLNICMWAFGFDFFTTVIYQPKILFPAMMMCPKGWLHSNSLAVAYGAFAMLLVFYSAGAISVLSAFAYRYAVMNDLAQKMLSKRFLVPLGLFHFLYMAPTVVFYILSIGDRQAIEASLKQTWPGISRHFEQHEACSALSFQVTSFPYVFLLSCLVQFTAITPASVFLIYRCFTALKTRKRLMSTRTYRMHRQLLVTLVCQLLVPLVTLILPNTLNACFTLFEIRRFSALPLVLFLLATLHSPLNAVMMLSLIGPYRRFLLSLLWRMRQQASTQEAQSGPSMAIHSRTRVADVGSRKF